MSLVQLRSEHRSLQPGWAAGDPAIAAAYLHIPYCFHKCHYCDFYSLRDDDADRVTRHAAFARRLADEVRLRARQVRLHPATVFVGGGTPTLMPVTVWQAFLEAIHDTLTLYCTEFTVEANPETLDPILLAALRSGGINRISLGVQSFDPALLHVLERWHEPSSVPRAVDLARDAGFENLNLDLIFAIPGQTLSGLEADLDAALALQPEHLSCYNLMYEPNTAMTQRLKQGRFTPVDEDTERAMYQLIREHLAAAGFEQYEISNWARPGRRCRHNLHYWRNANWLGFGPSAASHVAGWRWKNVPRLQAYLDSVEEPPVQDVEHLSAERRAGEALMLRLRLLEGVELTWLASLLSAEDPRWRVITDLEQVGMLERTASHLRLTESGLMIADHVVGELL